MALIRTYESLCDDIRSQVDREGDPALGNEVLQPWIMQAIRKARLLAARMAPDEYTKVSSNLTVLTGNTFTVAPASDIMIARQVQRTEDGGVNWWPVPRFRLSQWGQQCRLAYVRRGRVFELLPAELALGTYRLIYVESPDEMPGTVQEMEFTQGEDEYVVADVAGRCRRKFEEDPVLELAARNDALEAMKQYLLLVTPPEPIAAANGWDDEGEGW
jgi:hypothetical protein